MSFYTYILYSDTLDRYYVGSCEQLETRLSQHNSGRNKSTKGGMPWALRYAEKFESRTQAINREREIKAKKSRKYIEWLINSAG